MKGYTQDQRKLHWWISRTELTLGLIILCLLVKLYYPIPLYINQTKEDEHIFTCHAPQPSLLNHHDIDRSAFDSDIKWIQSTIEEAVKKRKSSGDGQDIDSIAISIFLPSGPPIYETGFGKVKANESESSVPDGDSIYRMASISKMFTTAQLMLQKQRKEVDLDQDVSSILDDFHPSTKGWTGPVEKNVITIRQLLSHTSGLSRDVGADVPWPGSMNDVKIELPDDPPTRAEIMAKIRDTPPVMPGYTTPIYSNIAFDVAGYVAEEIAKTKFVDLLEQDIFKPLKMSSASFKRQHDKLDRVVVPSEPSSIWADVELGDENPAGGLYCSAADLRRFGQELLGPGIDSHTRSGATGSLFNKISTREWLRPVHVFDDGILSIGLNWEIFTVPVGKRRMSLYTKSGTLPGFHTLFGVDPEREFGFALLISGETSINWELGIRIMTRFAETLDRQRQEILSEEFVGTYTKDASNVIKLELIDGGLAMVEAIIDGEDVIKNLHLGEGEGNYVVLWPTGEASAWRLAIGRPPALPYVGCMFKFASIDGATSKGFPIDLLVLQHGTLFYGALNQTFTRQ